MHHLPWRSTSLSSDEQVHIAADYIESLSLLLQCDGWLTLVAALEDQIREGRDWLERGGENCEYVRGKIHLARQVIALPDDRIESAREFIGSRGDV